MRLTLDLPEDVWRRLKAEAEENNKTIGGHVRSLIVARDKRVSEKSDTREEQ